MPNEKILERNLDKPEYYYNRELSSLDFNARVLSQSQNHLTPLLERLRFITIVSSNLDEFFEVRVAGIKQINALGLSMRTPDQMTPLSLLRTINKKVKELIQEQYQILNDELLPALREKGMFLIKRKDWTKAQKAWIYDHFKRQVMPVLTPMGLDPAHPFPNVQNKSLNFILKLRGTDAYGRESGYAILPVPRCLPRIISLPPDITDGHGFVLISSVIHAHVDLLFPGMEVKGCFQFRVTRNADMLVDEEEIDDLLIALKGELHGRHFGNAVRLEVANNCPAHMIDLLLEQHDLTREHDLYQVNGPVNLHRLGALVDLADLPQLKYPPFSPGVPERLGPKKNIINVIRNEDVLLHHPFRSFNPVVDLLWEAAEDPAVLAMKMTLYRVGKNSPIVDALISAARANKDVTAIVELRARFDEAENIGLATRLTEAGCKVVYGVVNYKCHAKMLMLVRREGGSLKRYVHLGTGNYHIRNSRLYTDYSFMTSNEAISKDVHRVFLQLTGLGKLTKLKKLMQSPFTLFPGLLELIRIERENALAGKPAYIVAKMNSLTEPTIIKALYEASQVGVKIQLLIRGICSLRPNLPGISDNIVVHSVIGRFLEHHRCYLFANAGKEKVFLASADWMDRNLHRRVETCCPIEDEDLKNRISIELQEIYLRDNQNTWLMTSNGDYNRRMPNEGEVHFCAHDHLLKELGD